MACSDGCELAEEKDLNALPAAVKCHLSSSQQNTCELSNIFNIHVLLWSLVELKALLFGNNGNDLDIHWRLFLLRPEQKGNYILTSCTLTNISWLSPDAVSCFRTRCQHFQNDSSELLYLMPGQCRPFLPRRMSHRQPKIHTENGSSHLSLRSIASAVPGRHQYTDNIYQEATSELST